MDTGGANLEVEREKTKGKNYTKIKHTIVTHFWYGLLKPAEKYKHKYKYKYKYRYMPAD